MDYFIGAITTLLCILAVYPFVRAQVNKINKINVQYRQSYNFSLVQPWASISKPQKELVTQATKHHDANSTRVVISNDKAYWIFNNQLLSAEVVDGKVDGNTTQKVDTMALNDVELNNLAFIVDKLTEGTQHESSDSRDEEF